MIINRDTFFAAVRVAPFNGHLAQSQVDGMNVILDCWEATYRVNDPRWVAYSLATTDWETAHTMQPIEEYGKGAGHSYGLPTGPWQMAYYGRGFVQLTFEANYVHATKRLRELGVIDTSIDLEKKPELAMRPMIAGMILVIGMVEGWFTGKKLSDFFHDTVSDPLNARSIINGHDKAAEIAAIYQHFVEAVAHSTTASVPLVGAAPLAPSPVVKAPAVQTFGNNVLGYLAPLVATSANPIPKPSVAPSKPPANGLWAWLLAFLKPAPVGNRQNSLLGDTNMATTVVTTQPSVLNGMKTYLLTTILGTLSAAFGAAGTIDVKTGIGGVLVAGILFALRHGLSTSVATIVASFAGIVQSAISSSFPTEANLAGLVKVAVAEALAEQAAATVTVAPAATTTTTTTTPTA